MVKMKKIYNSIPLWLMLFLMIAAALLIAGIGTYLISSAARNKANEIQGRYITATYVETNGDVMYSFDFDFHYENYTSEDMRIYKISRFIENYAYLFLYSICIVSAVIAFYITKLKRPLRILRNASRRISENELDFTVDYTGSDEMSKLCESFEIMRSALMENNEKTLRILDERKQLNDAYTHDLRTPIAVLKGYAEMLVKFLPSGRFSESEVMDTVRTMSLQIKRLEQFVDSMNTVQKLDDINIQKKEVPAGEFLNHLRGTAELLCQSENLICKFETEVNSEVIFADASAVTQVFENLIGNSIRFAKSKITVRCLTDKNAFSISVIDDGKGFSEKELLMATKPYYSGKSQNDEVHFGLGLHICRTLCEKHGGALRLENTPQRGAKVTAIFYKNLPPF